MADADCQRGAICEAQQCVAGCRDDRDCPRGLRCSEAGSCVQCVEDRHCPRPLNQPYNVCEAGLCREGCRVQGHCQGVLRCNPVLARCVTCLADPDCDDAERCVGGTCQLRCRIDAECEALGLVCSEIGACVECRDADDCGGAICLDETSACFACEEDVLCGAGAYCDWVDGRCHTAVPGQPLCASCGSDEGCDDGICVRHSSYGQQLERFCGSRCERSEDCPRGFACGRVGDRGFACMPDGLEYGLTCAAVRSLGEPCGGDNDCGIGDEGRCHEGACTVGCEEQGAARRFCPEGFECRAAPREVHPWGYVCRRPED